MKIWWKFLLKITFSSKNKKCFLGVKNRPRAARRVRGPLLDPSRTRVLPSPVDQIYTYSCRFLDTFEIFFTFLNIFLQNIFQFFQFLNFFSKNVLEIFLSIFMKKWKSRSKIDKNLCFSCLKLIHIIEYRQDRPTTWCNGSVFRQTLIKKGLFLIEK